jgi:hypothetical protein
MKIRIKGNSLRIRLSRTEVNKLATDGYLEEKTEFPSANFCYALKRKDDIKHLEADFINNTVTMYVPEALTTAWPDNEIVGFDHKVELKTGALLSLLLEKDFKCIDADVLEDQSDNFEHPSISC